MSDRYLVSCPKCQAQIPTTLAQAGETRRCVCGADVLVPTLRELRQLPRAGASEAAGPQDSWNPTRGVLFAMGLVLMVAAVGIHLRLQRQRSQLELNAPVFRELSRDLRAIGPMEAWTAWLHFRTQTLETRDQPEFLENRRKHRELTAYLYVAWTVGTLGILLVTGALLWPRRRGSASVDRR